jgi:DNA-binding IclR family transcriptional regulator
MLEYGAIVLERSKIIPIARPFIIELNKKTGFSVNLTVKEEDRLLFIDKSESFIALQYSTTVGRSRDLHYGSAGKMFMADLDEQTVREILMHSPLKKYTDSSITDTQLFLNELKRVKEQGYAIDNNESNLNAIAVSAAIRNVHNQIVAVITAVGPHQLISDYPLSKLITQVTECASQISLKFI